jgi:hypothetical protein
MSSPERELQFLSSQLPLGIFVWIVGLLIGVPISKLWIRITSVLNLSRSLAMILCATLASLCVLACVYWISDTLSEGTSVYEQGRPLPLALIYAGLSGGVAGLVFWGMTRKDQP